MNPDLTSRDPEAIVNVARFLPRAALKMPDRRAVMIPREEGPRERVSYRTRTFAELERDTALTASYLHLRGVRRDMRTLLMVRPGLDLILLTFALFRIGAVPILIDPGMGLKNFLRCVRRSGPAALLGSPLLHLLSRICFPFFRSANIRLPVVAGRFERAIGKLAKQSTPPPQPDRGGAKTASEKAAEGIAENRDASSPQSPDPAFPIAPTRARDLAAILFTSGSTGPPKGVRYEHAVFEAQVRLIREAYAVESGEVDLPLLPIFALFNPALEMTTVVPPLNPRKPASLDPGKIVRAINQCAVSNSFGSPVLWRKIGRYCAENKITLPSLRRVLMAGAPVSPQLLRDFGKIIPNGTIHTPYGATECLPLSSLSGLEIPGPQKKSEGRAGAVCVGRIMPELKVRVIAICDRSIPAFHPRLEVPRGKVGEIIARGPIVTRAYDRLEAENAMAKIRDGDAVWHRMGDLGYFDEEGLLWFCGRKAERVVTPCGELYPVCCESVFNAHPAVYRSALIGLGEPGRQVPAIVIEPEKGKFPVFPRARERFIEELAALGAAAETTRAIQRFFFHRKFPVDVRHNAKIHRLALKRHFEKESD